MQQQRGLRQYWQVPLLVAALAAATEPALAQIPAVTSGGGFVPAARTLFAVDFTQDPLGDFPKGLRYQSGAMEVVERDGIRMLRATNESEFLIPLPELLPASFTLEFDFVARVPNYAMDELGFAGGMSLRPTEGSAYVRWHQRALRIQGGAMDGGRIRDISTVMPDDLAGELQGQLGEVRVTMDGTAFKLYTNGRRLVNIPELRFLRSRVLRVYLGGVETQPNGEVYLARVRVATNEPPPGGVIAGANPAGAVQQQSGLLGGTSVVSGITITPGSAGPVVSWALMPTPATYIVSRWLTNDPACCTSGSPQLSGPPWQDTPLPMSGTYTYRVIATPLATTAQGEAQFTYLAATGVPRTGTIVQPDAPPLPPPPPPPPPAINPVTGMPSSGPVVKPVAPPPPPPATPIILAPATAPTATGMTTADPSARYRVTIPGFLAVQESLDDMLERDGKRNEVYAAAVAVLWDRNQNRILRSGFAKSLEYGDIGNGTVFPSRIRAGSASPQGGIWGGNGGDLVPSSYDPRGTVLPPPVVDQFPLLVWEGALSNSVEGLVIIPSLWERDTDARPFANYQAQWLGSTTPTPACTSNCATSAILSLPAIAGQLSSPGVYFVLGPIDPAQTAAQATATLFLAPLVGSFLLDRALLGVSSDRPIGIVELPLASAYQERYVVLTREKLASLQVGGGMTVPIPFVESPSLGGNFMLFLRVERLP